MPTTLSRPGARAGLPQWQLALLGALLLFSRFPQGVLHAELWGDEGWTFYPQAYQLGLRSLLLPVNGYLNTAQRLGAVLAVVVHVPLSAVPRLFALTALGAQLSVALMLTGPRLAPLWPDRRGRIVAACLYLALPNSQETFGNLTNIQWHLSLLAFMIVLAPAAGPRRRIGDAGVLLLSGLSGPFCILLSPFALFGLWRSRSGGRPAAPAATAAALVLGCALIQIGVLLFDNRIRHAGGLDTPTVFARIISLQVVLGLLLGVNTIVHLAALPAWQADVWPWLIAGLAAAACVIGGLRGGRLLRAFLVYCALVLASELASPVVAPGISPWHQLMTPWACQRYFLMPMLGLAALVLSLAGGASRAERGIGRAALAVIVLWAVPHDWSYPDLGRTDFSARARAFANAPPGTRAELPIHPRGAAPMILVKRPEP